MEPQDKPNQPLYAAFKRQPIHVKLIVVIVFSFFIAVTTALITAFPFLSEHIALDLQHKRVFTGVISKPEEPSPLINYDYPFQKEDFFVFVPESYQKRKSSFGLIVNIQAVPLIGLMPEGWQPILEKRNLLFIAPFYAGNDRADIDRTSLTVISALLMKRDYDIDPNRIYISGLSGGARIASLTSFLQSDIFKGSIQSCGSNFAKPVTLPQGRGLDTQSIPYVIEFYKHIAEFAKVKERVKFCLVTGPYDFRRFEVLAMYNEGFKKENYNCKLFDIPEIGHENCPPDILEKVLDYLDGKTN